MWQKNPRAQERARAKRKGSYPTKKQQEFLTTPTCVFFNVPTRTQPGSTNNINAYIYIRGVYIYICII